MTENHSNSAEKPAEDFGIYLRRWMQKRGHNIPSLAKLLKNESGEKMSVETVRRWVKGAGVPRRGMIEQIACVLHTDPGPFYQLVAGASLEDIEFVDSQKEETRQNQESELIERQYAESKAVDTTVIELDIKAALARIAALEQRLVSIEAKINT